MFPHKYNFHIMTTFRQLFVYFLIFELGYLQTIPENPCPNVFKYISTNRKVHGRVEFLNDNSGTYVLAVNMSVAAYLGNGQNIKLELLTSPNDIVRGGILVYNIYFPSQNAIPKPTNVEFNKRVYCSSPPERVQPGGYVTNLWADTSLDVTITHRPGQILQFPFESFELPKIPPTSTVSQTKPIAIDRTRTTSSFIFPFTEVTTKPTIATAPPVDYSKCGKPSIITIHLVRNGDDVEDGQYPWLAALMYKVVTDYKYRCTGTLVSNRHVVTAGHCLQYGKAPLFSPEELVVVLGTASLRQWVLTGIVIGVKEVSTHPAFVQDSADYDVSVITLNKQIEFTKNIQPICMWGSESDDLNDIVSNEGTVAGWGTDNADADYSPEAKRINLPIVSHKECLQSNIGFKSIISARTFCAGRRDNSGPCTGDSGAGFTMFRNGRWMLRGVTSIPLKDSDICDLENYFVFADLTKMKGWLTTVLT